MSYTIPTTCTLQSMLDITTSLGAATNLLTTKARMSFGSFYKLEFVVSRDSGVWLDGHMFIFNPLLYAPKQREIPIQLNYGWLITLKNISGTVTPFVELRNNGNEFAVKNYALSVELTTTTTMTVKFYFYAVQQVFDYITPNLTIESSNKTRCLSSALSQNLLDNTNLTAYKADTSYLEFVMYECDLSYNPASTTFPTDPYVRANSSYKQNSFQVALGFLDNVPSALQNYSGSALTKNNLSAFTNSIVGISKIAEVLRKGFPVLLPQNDANFTINTNSLALNINNSVSITIKCPEFVPTKAIVRLIKVDTSNLVDEQEFPIEYEFDTALLPNGNVVAPAWFNGGASKMGSPSTVNLGATTTLAFLVDGTRLQVNTKYRFLIGLYNNANLESTHLTPDMNVDIDAPAYADMSGVIQTSADTSHTGNDLTMAANERFRLGLAIDSATFTLANFTSLLKKVRCKTYTPFGALVEAAEYDFQTSQSSTNPSIYVEVAGTNYIFWCNKRTPYNVLPSLLSYTHIWEVVYQYPTTGGATQEIVYRFTQFVRTQPFNTTRIPLIRFLDYSDFQIAVFTEVSSLCSADDKVVVEVNKNAAPDALLQAIVVLGQTSSQLLNIQEEESYTPTYLPQATSPVIEDVDATFGDNKAYYVLNLSQVTSNFSNIRIGAVIKNI